MSTLNDHRLNTVEVIVLTMALSRIRRGVDIGQEFALVSVEALARLVDHPNAINPTRWTPGDRIDSVVYGPMTRGSYKWLVEDSPQIGPYPTDATVDEWIVTGQAVPLVEHGNRMTP